MVFNELQGTSPHEGMVGMDGQLLLAVDDPRAMEGVVEDDEVAIAAAARDKRVLDHVA